MGCVRLATMPFTSGNMGCRTPMTGQFSTGQLWKIVFSCQPTRISAQFSLSAAPTSHRWCCFDGNPDAALSHSLPFSSETYLPFKMRLKREAS
jgi:hypothetical protein